MTTSAALPPYDLPEIRAAHDAWWRGIARHLRRAGLKQVPDGLTRDDDVWALWRAPDLLLGQTCGYPLLFDLANDCQAVATPCYDTAWTEGPLYRSLVVVRADDPARALEDLRGRRVAINGRRSHSGYNVLRATVAPLARQGRFFGAVVKAGFHRHSLARVRGGEADTAAIDCVSYALIQRHAPPEVAGLRILHVTEAAPGLPYVTRVERDQDDVARLRDGLIAAAEDSDLAAARAALLIDGFSVTDNTDYTPIARMRRRADDAGLDDL